MAANALDQIVDKGCETALQSMVAYLRQRMLIPHAKADIDQLVKLGREEVKAAMDGALKDYSDAIGAGMCAVGRASFAASMSLAGVAAAKRYITWKESADVSAS
jgi:hypothetical protein